MRTLKDAIEEITHLRGEIEFSELNKSEQTVLLSYAVGSSDFDDIDTYLDGIAVPQLIQSLLNGIYDPEYVGEEILDRLSEYFEPIINKMFEDEHRIQYWENLEIDRQELINI